MGYRTKQKEEQYDISRNKLVNTSVIIVFTTTAQYYISVL